MHVPFIGNKNNSFSMLYSKTTALATWVFVHLSLYFPSIFSGTIAVDKSLSTCLKEITYQIKYSNIQMFVSDLRQVGGFLQVPP
jgi:hypothetical protein